MSNAHYPETIEAAGAQDDTAIVGTFVEKRNSARAEILSLMLLGEVLTGMDGISAASTTRLSAHIHALIKNRGWPIKSQPLTVANADGRVSEICTYSIPAPSRRAAFSAGAAEFVSDVATQRKALRSQRSKARREAERRNQARATARNDPEQGTLFDGGAQ